MITANFYLTTYFQIVNMRIVVHFSDFFLPYSSTVCDLKRDASSCNSLLPFKEILRNGESTGRWICKPTACLPTSFLHGPASSRDTRTIIYPCRRKHCRIGCPCPDCRIGNSEHFISTQQERYKFHQLYHHAPHLNCEFCIELLRIFPAFTYTRITSETVWYGPVKKEKRFRRKSFTFKHTYDIGHSESKHNWNAMTEEFENPRKCPDCSKLFKKACNKERHYRNVHYKQKYQCDICKKWFGRFDNLKTHKRKQHKIEPVESSDDEDSSVEGSFGVKITSDETDSNIEKDETDSNAFEVANDVEDALCDGNSGEDNECSVKEFEFKEFQCDLCGKTLSTKYNLEVHKSKQKYSCQECEQSFCSKTCLKGHIQFKHGKTTFKCQFCEREFTAKASLKRHKDSRTASSCDQCLKVLCNPQDLRNHVYNEHKSQQCQYCGNKYQYLDHHVLSVHGNGSKD